MVRGLGWRILRRWRRRGAAATAVVLSVCMVAACGGGATNGAGGDGDSDFVTVYEGVTDTLDFWGPFSLTMLPIGYELGSTLVKPKVDGMAGQGCDQVSDQVEPNLAESWVRLENGNIRFTLREGVKSAAGNTLTAEDVKWSLDTYTAENPFSAQNWHSFADFDSENMFTVVDDRTIEVAVRNPTTVDLLLFTWPLMPIMDSKEVLSHATSDDPTAKEWRAKNFADFGPWQLESFDPGSEIVLKENPNYFGSDERGNVDRVVMRAVPDAGTRFQTVQSGDADYATGLTFEQYSQLAGDDRFEVSSCASAFRVSLILNQKDPKYSDPRVRKAISMALDRSAIAEGVFRNYGDPSEAGVSAIYPAEAATKGYTFDVEGAKALLAEAGYADGFTMKLLTSTVRGPWAPELATVIQHQLGEIGIDVKVTQIAGASDYSERYYSSNYEAIIYGERPQFPTPGTSLNVWNHSESDNNTMAYDNAKYDELASAIRFPQTDADRGEMLGEISDLIVDTNPQIYLVEERIQYALPSTTEVEGYYPHGQLIHSEVNK